MRRRRIAPRLLLLLCAAAAPGATAAATWLEEHGLVLRSHMEVALDAASSGKYAPPAPHAVRRRLERLHRADDAARRLEECSSPLVSWTTQRVRDMGYKTYKELHENRILSMAYVYKHYVDRNDGVEFFVNDVQTEELLRRHRDTIAFWSAADADDTLHTSELLLLSMHGGDLLDNAKLVPTILKMFDYADMSDVLAFANKVKGLISDLPDGPNNPLLTMNAVATRSTHDYGSYGGHADASRRTKDSIILGDGVLKFLYDSGLESSGPDFVHAHEFGHHLQFQMVDNLRRSNHAGISASAIESFRRDDRKKELMADALGGYFLTHDDGGDMTAAEVAVFDRTAFSTGDCSEGEEDHHGTPKQRGCAAVWGASAAARGLEGHPVSYNRRGGVEAPVLDAEVFVAGFVEAYPGMLALDPAVCALVLEETSVDEPPSSSGSANFPSKEFMEGGVAGNGAAGSVANPPEEGRGSGGVDLDGWLSGNGGRYSQTGGDSNGDGGDGGPGTHPGGWTNKYENNYDGDVEEVGAGVDLQEWLNEVEAHNARVDADQKAKNNGKQTAGNFGTASRGEHDGGGGSYRPADHSEVGRKPPENQMRGDGYGGGGRSDGPGRVKGTVTAVDCDMPGSPCSHAAAPNASGFAWHLGLAAAAAAWMMRF